jgi:DNA repair protein RadC
MITIIFFTLTSGIAAYFIYRAYTLANVSADQEEYIQELEDMSQYMYNQIENAYQIIKQIDSKGAFEKDDETGTVFDQLNQVITNLQKEFNAEEEEKK